MILLRANPELRQTFEKLITTMKVPVKWNGIFAVIDNCIILQGEVRSLFFHFDSRKVVTNIIELPVKEEEILDTADSIEVCNVINMILYVFGKWGTIKGLKVEKNYVQLNRLFTGIMKGLYVEPEYTREFFRFYKEGIRITYEDVIQAALEAEEEQPPETEEEGKGLWHKVVWKKADVTFQKVDTTLQERLKGRLGNNFYTVGYLCPICHEKLHMVVYPVTKEFRIETDEGGVLLARACACDHCNCFYTPRPGRLLSEGKAYIMQFEDDRKAYEDYLELLGRNGERISNYNCNEYADKRKTSEDTADAEENGAEESLEEICENLKDCGRDEYETLAARMEEGFYPDESIRRYESKVKERKRYPFHSGMREKDREKHRRGFADNEEGDSPEEISLQNRKREPRQKPENSFGHESEQAARSRTYAAQTERSGGTGGGNAGTGAGNAGMGSRNDTGTREHSAQQRQQHEPDEVTRRQTSRVGQNVKVSLDERSSQWGTPRMESESRDFVSKEDEQEAIRQKYEAKIKVCARFSDRQLRELKDQLTREKRLDEKVRQEYLDEVEKRLSGERVAQLTQKVESCKGKNYAVLKRVLDEVERAEIPQSGRQPLVERLKDWMRQQGEQEVGQVMAKMPPHMDRSQYKHFMEKIQGYEGVNLALYEEKLRSSREAAERQEIANVVRRSRVNNREDLAVLADKLRDGDFLPELVAPYLEKVEGKIRRLDEEAIEELIGDASDMTFEEGQKVYEQIEQGEFLPELKSNALEMLTKRLSKIKADESELLVKKLEEELKEAGIAENSRHYFYPARRVLLNQVQPEETEVIDFAMASYAAGCGPFEYPVFVVDTSRNESGKEGIILTPDHLYYSTMLSAYGISVASIEKITSATGLLNKGLYVHQRNGTKTKVPYAVDTKELPALAKVLDEFIHYLQEKPDSRNVDYLAKEKHETICCFRCGYIYKSGNICPKCGYKKND